MSNMLSSKFTYTYFLLIKARTLYKFQSEYKDVLCKEALLTESISCPLWPKIKVKKLLEKYSTDINP